MMASSQSELFIAIPEDFQAEIKPHWPDNTEQAGFIIEAATGNTMAVDTVSAPPRVGTFLSKLYSYRSAMINKETFEACEPHCNKCTFERASAIAKDQDQPELGSIQICENMKIAIIYNKFFDKPTSSYQKEQLMHTIINQPILKENNIRSKIKEDKGPLRDFYFFRGQEKLVIEISSSKIQQ